VFVMSFLRSDTSDVVSSLTRSRHAKSNPKCRIGEAKRWFRRKRLGATAPQADPVISGPEGSPDGVRGRRGIIS
jgi:hypothetical protein